MRSCAVPSPVRCRGRRASGRSAAQEQLVSLVTEDRVDRALGFLAETDRECAAWKGAVLRTEHVAKVAEAMAFKLAEGSSAEERKQLSRTTPEVLAKWEEHFQAVTQYETVRARREREMLIVDLYRTESANRRQGNVS